MPRHKKDSKWEVSVNSMKALLAAGFSGREMLKKLPVKACKPAVF